MPKSKRRTRHLSTNPIEVRRRWRRRIEGLINDLSHLLSKRQVYLELVDIIEGNERALRQPAFFHWMRDNYVIAVCVGVRRFTDPDTRSISLRRLLDELHEQPEVLNRSALKRHFQRLGKPSRWADGCFDRMVGPERSHLTRACVRQDIAELKRVEERIRRFVNKRIAHRAHRSSIRKLPRFQDVDNALKSIDRILMKYHLLLTGIGLSSAFATPQYDWRRVLLERWVNRPADLPTRRYGLP